MSGEEELRRQDLDCYCPRVNQQVLILGDTCFFSDKKREVCQGCVFDGDFVRVKIILLLAEMLEDPEKRKDDSCRMLEVENC